MKIVLQLTGVYVRHGEGEQALDWAWTRACLPPQVTQLLLVVLQVAQFELQATQALKLLSK